ncbi:MULTISPECIES: nucleotidyltransferase domain-containing protein [unclassified Candidatus Frackibacter]|uniref:nucleotidyltransferase domain-containing protein n=1 Tax=unclassified Candidatus Frackibacter TaxID=2648818 RepID=UPI0008897BAF|nr:MULTISPECIES: nucleotidyltransferase domain-containing protein [unclassified Candidatus Frackibacter]SDC08064.1 Nucleotidyltransferase domain-containing protein [Candidatus Frackibacter sp. WG11]SEM38494.1 Nucleotidyltransferase domain-containing protein [Candidatus Frackibacter sp. WG12]SFL44154.1 Nucleotidyltransferase domain-containing protein [Candidatus Frackibacter sp. WG13]
MSANVYQEKDLDIEAYLEDVKERTVQSIDLNRIILFGSYARGDYNDNSDVDLLFIVNNDSGSLREIRHKIDSLLQDRIVPTDILVYTEDKLKEKENIIGTLPYTIKEEGEVIYDKQRKN